MKAGRHLPRLPERRTPGRPPGRGCEEAGEQGLRKAVFSAAAVGAAFSYNTPFNAVGRLLRG